MLEHYRRELKEGVASYWSVGAAYGLDDLGATGKRVDAILFGDCDIQMEADFLRREAARRGIDLHVSATFPDDIRFAAEHKHDAIFIGALRARHLWRGYRRLQSACGLYRAYHRASEQVARDNLGADPDRQSAGADGAAAGLAERGVKGHRTRFRLTNVALAELASAFADVYVIDVAAALAAVGSERLLDDGQVGFTPFRLAGMDAAAARK